MINAKDIFLKKLFSMDCDNWLLQSVRDNNEYYGSGYIDENTIYYIKYYPEENYSPDTVTVVKISLPDDIEEDTYVFDRNEVKALLSIIQHNDGELNRIRRRYYERDNNTVEEC